MEIRLAGTNVPLEILKTLPEEEKLKATPEVISAAYARISRSEKNVDELVSESLENIQKSRKSNEAILYGMGHHSVADHAIFNLNIKGVSRLLAESIEKRRLAGYTEKSQRYVTLEGDYIKPKEFNKQDLEKFDELVKLQNDFYFKAVPLLTKLLETKNSKKLITLTDKSRQSLLTELQTLSKEDARYSLCLATETQLGCSYTGQTAELAIRELKYGRLKEEMEFAQLLYSAIIEKAPSLIQLAAPDLFKQQNVTGNSSLPKTLSLSEQMSLFSKRSSSSRAAPKEELQEDNFKYTEQKLREFIEKNFKSIPSLFYIDESMQTKEEVTLVNHNTPDREILTALLHLYSNKPINECYTFSEQLITTGKAINFIKEALKYISEFDKVPRAFEAGFLIYEIVLSATSFAQLKRHRMNTLLTQDYDPVLGYTIPPNIQEVGLSRELKEVCDKSTDLYNEFKPSYGKAAEYCLTNAHKRRVLLGINVRQLYHISRIREDKSAQWDIRDKVTQMSNLAKKVAPITTILLAGKHDFKKIYNKVMK
ncbi:MAG: FAD-dependent thymidylate synthase [bacterium]